MNKENNTPFKVEDVNWEELAGIGILKDELEMSGELDTLLKGEKTNVIRLSLVLTPRYSWCARTADRCSKSSASNPSDNSSPSLYIICKLNV